MQIRWEFTELWACKDQKYAIAETRDPPDYLYCKKLEDGGMRSLSGLQGMAVSNEISGVQEQNIECASVQFYLSVHFKCAHKILNLYLHEILTKKVYNDCCENIPIQRLFCPVFRQKQFGPKFDCTRRNATGIHRLITMIPRSQLSKQDCLRWLIQQL